MPCRSQGQGASGIIYVLSRDDTAVVASYLKVIQPPIFIMQHCTLAIQLSMQREPAHECKGLNPSTGCARCKMRLPVCTRLTAEENQTYRTNSMASNKNACVRRMRARLLLATIMRA